MAPISEGECILCGRWPEKDRWALRDAIEILPWEDDGVCDACFAMTILHHPHGSDEWIVSEDNDKEIKLRASELTSYRRFHMHAIQVLALVSADDRRGMERHSSESIARGADKCDVPPMQIQAVAHHEAGHAVASVLLQCPVRYVEITDHGTGNWTGNCVNLANWHHSPHAMESQIIIHLSGGIAEAVYRGETRRLKVLQFAQDHCCMDTDMSRADAVGRALSREAGVYFEQQLVDRTLLLLLKNWAAVEAVADALLRHRRIEGGRVQWIIDRSSA